MRYVKVVLWALVTLLFVGAVSLGFLLFSGWIFADIARVTGFEWIEVYGSVALFLLLLVFFPRRWLVYRRPYRCHARTVIAAPLQRIWDEVVPRERTDPFQATVARIERVPGDPARFDYVFDDRLADPVTGELAVLTVRIAESERLDYLRLDYPDPGAMPAFARDLVSTEVHLLPVEGGIEVRYVETLSRLTLVSFLALLLMNPARDVLKRLKARCEDRKDTSRMGAWMRELNAENGPGRGLRTAASAVVAAGLAGSVGLVAAAIWLALRLVNAG